MANSWFRMYSEFANDPKVRMMPENYQLRLVLLFCMRCNGDVTLRNEEVAFQLRISDEEWQATKAEFMQRGFVNEANEVLNWDKRQYRSDSSAERVRKHRETKKQGDVTACNVTVTPQNRTDTDTDTDTDNTPLPPKSKISAMPFQEIPPEWETWAKREKGWSEEVVVDVWSVFREHWQNGKGARTKREEWFSTWRTWVRKENIPKSFDKPKRQLSNKTVIGAPC